MDWSSKCKKIKAVVFDIDGTIICEDCLTDYKKYTEDYIEEQKERNYYD